MYRKMNQGYGNESKRNANHQMQAAYSTMSHDMQGNYQGSQMSMQQGNYKQNVSPNSQGMKTQQQQQQPAHMRPPPLSGKSQQQAQQSAPSQQQQQQQQQQHQQQQHQQHQQQHQQQQHQQQQHPQQQHPQQQHQQQLQSSSQQRLPAPLLQRLKPILKNSTAIPGLSNVTQNTPTPPASTPPPPALSSAPPPPPSPSPVPGDNIVDNQTEKSDKRDGEQQDGHPRWRRKIPGFKVNKKLKRLRMNQRLRKTLQPKNAIMVLNEMKAGVQFTYPETQMTNSGDKFSLYVVHAELDGKTYVGQGLSKPQARQNAAENALKGLLLEKMTVASMKARIDAESDSQSDVRMDSESDGQLDEKSMSSNSEMKDENNDDSSTAMDTANAEDEIPWSSLASFALYKLFLEWHNQGTSVPVPRPGLPTGKGSKRDNSITRPQVQKELPPNPTNIHPVMLLNQVRPGLTYVEVSRSGNPPNTMFTLAVDVNGTEYSGTAKNKKDAKKIAAKAALSALYGLTYPEDITKEETMDVQ